MIKILHKRALRFAILGAILMGGLAGMAAAQDNDTAEAALGRAISHYAEAEQWYGTVQIGVRQTLGEQSQAETVSFGIALQRPGSVMVAASKATGGGTYIRAGKTSYALNGQWNKYLHETAEPMPVEQALVQQFPSSITQAGPMSGASFLAALFAKDAPDALMEEFANVEMGEKRTVEGVEALHVRVENDQGFQSYYLHPETHRILQIRINPSKAVEDAVQREPRLEGLEVRYTIDLEPAGALPEAVFQPEPPESAVKVEGMRELFDPVGGTMADFKLPALHDGETVKLSDHKGKVVFVDFFATWCGPCRAALPEMEQLYQTYGEDGFTVIAVNVNEPRDVVQPFVENMEMSFPVAMDMDGSLMRSAGFRSFPTTVVLDQNLKVVDIHQGFRPGMEKKMADEIEALLNDDE